MRGRVIVIFKLFEDCHTEQEVDIIHSVLETKVTSRTFMATNFLIINLPHNMQDEFKQRQDKHVMNVVEKMTVIQRMTRIVEHQGLFNYNCTFKKGKACGYF